MLPRVAALVFGVRAESGRLLVAARIPGEVLLEEEDWLLWVIGAVVNVGSDELLVAFSALELLKSGKHLPEDLLPADLLLSQVKHELIDVPVLICDVFRHNSAVDVNE